MTAIAALLLLTACTPRERQYKIGVSQCSEDIWREKQNAELRMSAYIQGNVELRFAAAYDSDQRQIEQIDSLVASGIDLLIVAPNQIATISPAIDRAYDKGIPVIVFERKTNSQKYTAFISADNYEMGHVMGEYIASQLHGKGRVLEIKGLEGSSPAIERHNGFIDALKDAHSIEVVASLQGDWTEESAYQAMEQWLSANPNTMVDYIFGQNDRMAMGARKAIANSPSSLLTPLSTLFCGIDGLPDENGGIRLVRDSVLNASYIYPTHGDKLLQVAVDILEGKPYNKETKLMSALVTSSNANVLLMQAEETMHQTAYLDQLHEKADGYLQQLDTQRTITLLAVILIVLLLIVIVLFYLYYLGRIKQQREHVVSTLWNMKTEDIPAPEEVKADDTPDNENPESVTTSLFISRFKEAVEKRLTDSELSVEDLAADMNLSRVQLYRKVKATTGSTPIELLRTARLNRGYAISSC